MSTDAGEFLERLAPLQESTISKPFPHFAEHCFSVFDLGEIMCSVKRDIKQSSLELFPSLLVISLQSFLIILVLIATKLRV